jgi:hypothetical protein
MDTVVDSKNLQLLFPYPCTRLFNTQRCFVSKNRISAETCLPTRFLETGLHDGYLCCRPWDVYYSDRLTYWRTLLKIYGIRFNNEFHLMSCDICWPGLKLKLRNTRDDKIFGEYVFLNFKCKYLIILQISLLIVPFCLFWICRISETISDN